jgi:hypothetical protein
MLTHHLSVKFHVTVQLGANAVLTHADSPPVCHLPWQCPRSSAQSAACSSNTQDSGCQSCRAVTLAKATFSIRGSVCCVIRLPNAAGVVLSSYIQLLHVSHAGRIILKQAAPQSSQTRSTPVTWWSPGRGSPPAACCCSQPGTGTSTPNNQTQQHVTAPHHSGTSATLLTCWSPGRGSPPAACCCSQPGTGTSMPTNQQIQQ